MDLEEGGQSQTVSVYILVQILASYVILGKELEQSVPQLPFRTDEYKKRVVNEDSMSCVKHWELHLATLSAVTTTTTTTILRASI